MAAPSGNQYWSLRKKHGRDKLYDTPEELWIAACKYFQWCDKHPWFKNEQLKKPYTYLDDKGKKVVVTIVQIPTARPYTITGLCQHMGCNSAYLRQFNDEKDEGFSTIITRIEEIIYTQKFEGASVGAFNANIIARDLGLADKKDITERTIHVEVEEDE